MIRTIEHIKDVAQGKTSLFKRRSKRWRNVRNEFVRKNPTCAVCGTKKKLEVHHKKPFYLFPELELSYNNLITLCKRDHYIFGHLCFFKSFNEEVEYDCLVFRKKIKDRP